MKVFLVVRDVKGIAMTDLHGVIAAAQRQAEAMLEMGDRIRLVRSTYLPEQGRCLCLFEAKSAVEVAELNDSARLTYERIVPALELVR